MKSICLFIFICFFSFSGFSQGRIGFDVSSRLQGNRNITFNYHHRYKEKILFSASAFMGGNGVAFIRQDTNSFNDGRRIDSPYPSVNKPVIDSGGSYALTAYETTARNFGFGFGIGTFTKLNDYNFIRGHIYSKFGVASANVRGYYRTSGTTSSSSYLEKNTAVPLYFFSSVSLEAYHMVLLSQRIAFNWGIKAPFYFLVDKQRFNTSNDQDLHFGFELEVTAGFSFYLGQVEKPKD